MTYFIPVGPKQINLEGMEWIYLTQDQWYSAGLREDNRDSKSPGRSWEFFSSPLRLDRFWGSLSLLSNEYQGLFPWG
jgi:hypothetical protein